MQFYIKLYLDQFSWRPKLDALSFTSIGDDEGSWLERDFKVSGVFEVVRALNGDNASDLNGLSLAFIFEGRLKRALMEHLSLLSVRKLVQWMEKTFVQLV